MLNKKHSRNLEPERAPDEEELAKKKELRQVGGAAVAGGLTGLVMAGPIVGLVTAGGAAVVATSKGKAGKIARAAGEVAVSTGDRLKKLDQKHKIAEKTANGAKEVGNSLKRFDKEHKITEMTSKGVKEMGNGLKEFDRRHHIVERTSKRIVKGCNWISRKIAQEGITANSDGGISLTA